MNASITSFLQRFCTRRVFKDWAPDYESDVRRHDYSAARRVVKAALPLVRPGMTLVDIGIGTGLVSGALKKHEAALHLTGLDISPDMLDLCEKAGAADSLHRIDVGKDGWPLDGSSQDMALAAGLFEYLTQTMVHHVLKEAYRTLKPGGLFIFTYLPAQTKKPSLSLWDGRSGKIFSCAYPPLWLEQNALAAGFNIDEHSAPFTGSVFEDKSSYDYRLIALTKAG